MNENKEWFYVKYYSGVNDNTDGLVAGLSAWLSDKKDRVRWHFLRYIDLDGHHIRVRLLGSPNAVDRWYADEQAAEELLAGANQSHKQRIFGDPSLKTNGAKVGYSLDIYSPEIHKYGSGEALGVCETHFDLSSDWCLNNEIWTWDYSRRIAWAALYLAGVREYLGADFMLHHQTQWGGRFKSAGCSSGSVHKAQKRALEVIGNSREELVSGMEDLVESLIHAASESAQRMFRAINLIHMDINRIGLNPVEECFAGLLTNNI